MTTTTSTDTRPTFTITTQDGTVTVIERFSIPPGDIAAASDAAREHIATRWRARSDYAGALLLGSRLVEANIFERRRVVGLTVYSRWTLDGGAAPVTVPPSWSMATALPGADLVDARTYTVDFTRSLTTGSAGTVVSVEEVPIAHFGLFTAFTAGQEALLVEARTHSEESFAAGGVVAVNFHTSLDGQQVINFGQWTTLDHLPTLADQQGFGEQDHYWDGLAEIDGMFFDLLAVDPAPEGAPARR